MATLAGALLIEVQCFASPVLLLGPSRQIEVPAQCLSYTASAIHVAGIAGEELRGSEELRERTSGRSGRDGRGVKDRKGGKGLAC